MATSMAAFRLLRLTSSSSPIFRALYTKLSSSVAFTPSFISRTPHVGPAAKVFSPRLHTVAFQAPRSAAAAAYSGFEHYSSSSNSVRAVEDEAEAPVEAAAGAVAPHPWPEWEGFLEKLKSKGYFEGASSGEGDVEEGGVAAAPTASSMDIDRAKVACLAFARDRFDLLGSLPKEDIQTVVECGCPNTHRKPVNSGKRLRAYLMLNEGDVCSACNLQGSCDRANLVLNEEEGARTVDILRIILPYAADPALLSRFEVAIRDQVEGSIRRLLSELIKLSDTILDRPIAKTMVKHLTLKKKPQRSKGVENIRSQNVEMKRGDWICSKCNFLNFAQNLRCLQCKADGPKRVDCEDAEMKKGDWTCPQCQFMNFARNKRCKRCQGQRPQRQLNPGEWECPSCDFLNFGRNRVCLKCKLQRPGKEPSEHAEHLWEKPDISIGKSSSAFK